MGTDTTLPRTRLERPPKRPLGTPKAPPRTINAGELQPGDPRPPCDLCGHRPSEIIAGVPPKARARLRLPPTILGSWLCRQCWGRLP